MFPTLNSANEANPHVDNNTKRLLTIDQVNEEFPVMMYKVWKATREKDGLLIESGITTRSINPPIHDNPDTILRNAVLERSDAAVAVQCSHKPETTDDASGISTDNVQAVNTMTSSVLSITSHCETKTDDLPLSPCPQFVGVVEDNCAICLEVPEDDDDVRGLKCGHCYHQTCIDPWLTSQRGACPLCKRDFIFLLSDSLLQSERTRCCGRQTNIDPLTKRRNPIPAVQNTRRNDLAPPPPAITRASWVNRMSDSWIVRTSHFLFLCMSFDESTTWERLKTIRVSLSVGKCKYCGSAIYSSSGEFGSIK